MIKFGVTINEEKLATAARGVARSLFEEIKRALGRYLLAFRGKMSRERLRGLPGLRRRTGMLTQSQKVVVVGETMQALRGTYTIGGGLVKYARLHEEGGVVRPVRAKFLAIPLPAAQTAAGVSRAVSPRDFKDTFIAKGVIFQRQGRKPSKKTAGAAPRIVPLFVLKRQVKIEPRLGALATFKADEPARRRFLGDAVRAALRKRGLL